MTALIDKLHRACDHAEKFGNGNIAASIIRELISILSHGSEQGGKAVASEWPPIASEYRPERADAEGDLLKSAINKFGAEAIFVFLRSAAFGAPKGGSAAGTLWAIYECLAHTFEAKHSAMSVPVTEAKSLSAPEECEHQFGQSNLSSDRRARCSKCGEFQNIEPDPRIAETMLKVAHGELPSTTTIDLSTPPLNTQDGVDDLTDDECDEIAAKTLDRVGAAKGLHGLEVNSDIRSHNTLRRALIRAARSNLSKNTEKKG